MHNGDWGSPKKLRALLCVCPPLEQTFVRGNAPMPDVKSQNWVALFRPEARHMSNNFENHLMSMANGSGKSGEESFHFSRIPVRYPAFDDNFGPINENIELKKTPLNLPIRFAFTAPIQVCNAICQPIMYRLADKDGIIVSEGVLVSGHSVNVHKIYNTLFQSEFFISIRLLNYCWSAWTRAFSLKHPFKAKENNTELTLNSMSLIFRGQNIFLPQVAINMIVEENYVLFSCPMILSNRTGLHLEFREPSENGYYIPHSSQVSTISLLKQNIISSSKTEKEKKTNFDPNEIVNKLLGDEQNNENDASDTDDDSEDDDSDNDSDDVSESNKPLTVEDSSMRHKKKTSASSMTTNPSSSNTATLFVHMPYDHIQRLDITIDTTCTLAEVFDRVKRHIPYLKFIHTSSSSSSSSAQPCMLRRSDYHFFEWENGRLETRAVEGIPIPTISEDSSKFIDIKDNEIPHPMKFGVLADCSTKPLDMNTKVSELNSLRIRLCHVLEWNLYLQVCSVEKHVVERKDSTSKRNGTKSTSTTSSGSISSAFTGMFKSKTNYVYTTPFFSFDGDVPFNPPRMLGGSVSCFNIR